MMVIMPSSEKTSIKGLACSGMSPVLPKMEPKNKKKRTGVSFVFRAKKD